MKEGLNLIWLKAQGGIRFMLKFICIYLAFFRPFSSSCCLLFSWYFFKKFQLNLCKSFTTKFGHILSVCVCVTFCLVCVCVVEAS